MADEGIERCETCGTTKITFDPPMYFTEVEACGEYVNVYIQLKSPNDTSRLNAFFLQERCVGPKGHYPETDHYILIEDTYNWRTNESKNSNSNSKNI